MTRSLLCIAALLCALAAPSAALAQGAGDQQYEDPFGDEQSQSQPTPTATPAPAQPAPAPAQPAPAQPAPSAPAPASAQASQGPQLPRTGVDAGWIALAGAVSLAAGLALRRRADHQR
jgi:2-oxoglutarate dehydrogenase E2 component (dihydrolipoamide succinyltransferase)